MADWLQTRRFLNNVYSKWMETNSGYECASGSDVEYFHEPEVSEEILTLLEEIKKDINNPDCSLTLPKKFLLKNHKKPECLFELAMADFDGKIFAYYSIDEDKDITKRWPDNTQIAQRLQNNA